MGVASWKWVLPILIILENSSTLILRDSNSWFNAGKRFDFISKEQLLKISKPLLKSGYGTYLQNLDA